MWSYKLEDLKKIAWDSSNANDRLFDIFVLEIEKNF